MKLTMNSTPRPFQTRTVEQIEQQNGRLLVAHEMGSGKSLTSLLYAYRNPEVFPIVVVCPASLKYNWEREAAVHFSWRAEVLEGTKPRQTVIPSNSRIIILNYDILQAWIPYLLDLKPGLLILDEVHYCSGKGTKRSRLSIQLADKIPRVIGLSGTPMTNRPIDLYNPLRIVAPKLFPSYYQFGHRYCLPADAPVLMANLKEKPISEIKPGDSVIGWGRPKDKPGRKRRLLSAVVLDVITKTAPLQKVTLHDGTELICTPDHKWHTGLSEGKLYEYSIARAGNVSGGGRGAASRIAKVFRGTSPIYKDDDYRLGYVHGFFRGDGYCSTHQERRYYPFKEKEKWMKVDHAAGCACKDEAPIKRIRKILDRLGVEYNWAHNGDMFTISSSKKSFFEFISEGSAQRDSDAWWAGFLGGIYDAEGSSMTIAQYRSVNPVTHKMIEDALGRFGFEARAEEEAVCIKGGRHEFLRFWNIANPSLRRKLIKTIMSSGARIGTSGYGFIHSGSTQIVDKIEPMPGVHLTYTLTTTTGNYVAYGCGSKNCGAKRSFFSGGWDFSGASNLDELNQKIQPVMSRLRKADVLSELPAQQDTIVLLDLTERREYEKVRDEYLAYVGDGKPSLLSGEERNKARGSLFRLKHLVAQLKLPAAFEWFDQFYSQTEEKIIAFGIHRESVVEALHKRYVGQSSIITGKVTGKHRQEAFDRFLRDKKCRQLAANIDAAGVGLSARGVSNTAFLELPWTPSKIDQGKARTHGIGRGEAGKVCQSWFLIARNTIESRLLSILQRKRSYSDQVLDGGQVSDPFELYDELTEMLKREREGERG